MTSGGMSGLSKANPSTSLAAASGNSPRHVLREGYLQVNTPAGLRQHYAVVLYDGIGGLVVEFYDCPGGCFEGQFHCIQGQLRQMLLLNLTPVMCFQTSNERSIALTTGKDEDFTAWFNMFTNGLRNAHEVGNSMCSIGLPIIRKSGFLYKTGPSGKSWKRRWFVLHDHVLQYFKTQKSGDALGRIDMDCSLGINAVPNCTLKGCVGFIIKTSSRVYNVAAENDSQRCEWLRALMLTGTTIISRTSRSTFYVGMTDDYMTTLSTDISSTGGGEGMNSIDYEDNSRNSSLSGEGASLASRGDFRRQSLLDEYLPMVSWLGAKFGELHEGFRPKALAKKVVGKMAVRAADEDLSSRVGDKLSGQTNYSAKNSSGGTASFGQQQQKGIWGSDVGDGPKDQGKPLSETGVRVLIESLHMEGDSSTA